MINENEPQIPKNYYLSRTQIESSPTHILDYKVGDKVTREKLTSFLIKSFAISRGRPVVQAIFFDFNSIKSESGFVASTNVYFKKLVEAENLPQGM